MRRIATVLILMVVVVSISVGQDNKGDGRLIEAFFNKKDIDGVCPEPSGNEDPKVLSLSALLCPEMASLFWAIAIGERWGDYENPRRIVLKELCANSTAKGKCSASQRGLSVINFYLDVFDNNILTIKSLSSIEKFNTINLAVSYIYFRRACSYYKLYIRQKAQADKALSTEMKNLLKKRGEGSCSMIQETIPRLLKYPEFFDKEHFYELLKYVRE